MHRWLKAKVGAYARQNRLTVVMSISILP